MKRVTVGEMVHYTSYGTPDGEYDKECRAAIVTAVHESPDPAHDRTVDLAILNPSGMFFSQNCPHDGVAPPYSGDENSDAPGEGFKIERGPSGRPGGTWHWVEWA